MKRYTIDYSWETKAGSNIYGEQISKEFDTWKAMESFIGLLQDIEICYKSVSYYAYDRKKNLCLAEQ